MDVERAIEWAVQLHRGHKREGDDPLPYVTHPVEVLLNLRTIGQVVDVDLLCAALLHDTVEGGSISYDEIEREAGKRVALLVRELTREEPSPDRLVGLKKPEIWKLRAEMLIEEVARMSPDAQQIKLADRLANLKEAVRMKGDKKLARYLWQTDRILSVVPRAVNVGLWNAIHSELVLRGYRSKGGGTP